ncbi:MAG: arylsulfatase [Planctomycetota bacterium]|jgi:arylsulfatase
MPPLGGSRFLSMRAMFSPASVCSLLGISVLTLAACSDAPSVDPVEPAASPADQSVREGPREQIPTRLVGSTGRRNLDLRYAKAVQFGDPKTVSSMDFEGSMPEGFEVSSGDHTWVKRHPRDPKGEKLLSVSGERIVLDIPLASDPAEVNQVAITFSNTGKLDFSVEMRRGNSRPIKTAVRRYDASNKLRTVLVDLPGILSQKRPFTSVTLHIPFTQRDMRLAQVALVWSPPALRLPAPNAPQPVTIYEESRPAVGLSREIALETRFTPGQGDQLVFDLGRPKSVLDSNVRISVRLTLMQGKTRKAFRYSLEPAREVSPWTTQRVDCSPFAGGEVVATFSLDDKDDDGTPLCALGVPRLVAGDRKGPCIVLVTSDTHRGDHVGYLEGAVDVSTPFLNELAGAGTAFEDCWVSTNITNPSHISLMTAMAPRDTGVIDNITAMSAAANTLAERFSEAGYTTLAATSASHMRPDQSGLAQGFDRISVPASAQRDSEQTLQVLFKWLEEAPPGPLFVWLHVFDAHGPYLPPEEYLEEYWDKDRDPRSKDLPEINPLTRASWETDVRDLDFVRAQYKGEVTYLDDQLRKAFEHPRLQDAVSAVTSDHGESLGNKGYYFEHQMLYPDTLAVPLIFHGPGVDSGEHVKRPVEQTDVGRTLLNLAGLQASDFPGSDLLAPEQGTRRPRFSIGSHGLGAGIQLDKWYMLLSLRLHRSGDSHDKVPAHFLELYDLSIDPTCQTNLVEEESKVARQLRGLLIKWLTEAPKENLAQSSTEQDTARIEQLVALGYAAGSSGGTEDWINPDCDCEHCEPFN